MKKDRAARARGAAVLPFRICLWAFGRPELHEILHGWDLMCYEQILFFSLEEIWSKMRSYWRRQKIARWDPKQLFLCFWIFVNVFFSFAVCAWFFFFALGIVLILSRVVFLWSFGTCIHVYILFVQKGNTNWVFSSLVNSFLKFLILVTSKFVTSNLILVEISGMKLGLSMPPLVAWSSKLLPPKVSSESKVGTVIWSK